MSGNDSGYLWVQDTSPGESNSGIALTISGLTEGVWELSWYNTWTGSYYSGPIPASSIGHSLTSTIPDFTNDIALRITLEDGTSHDLTMAVDPPEGGTTNPDIGSHFYTEGSVVDISATANTGYVFDHWGGDVANPNSASTTVTMSADKTVTAYFTQLTYTLTADNDGNGTVTLSPSGGTYASGTTVTLTPVPSQGYQFSSWSGANSGDIIDTAGVYTLVMDGDKTVQADFSQITYTLTAGNDGHGTVTLSPSGGTYASGTSVILIPVANTGYQFSAWSGANAGEVVNSPLGYTIMMDGDKTVQADFIINTYSLNVSKPGTGAGSVTSAPEGIDCGSACSASFDYNTSVTLTATAETGSTFAGWSGTCTGSLITCTILMEAAKTVTAIFTRNTDVTQPIPLVSGWNLVSFNLHPASTAITDVLSSLGSNYDLVYAWDASGGHSGAGNWMRYAPGIPGNTLETLDETQGFWIRMTIADMLDITGTTPTTTNISLLTTASGWNLVGYPSVQNRSMPEALTTHGVTDYSLVYAYHANDADTWKRYAPGVPGNDLLELAPGWGYWIKVGTTSTWDVEY
jgi:hypothetical protein